MLPRKRCAVRRARPQKPSSSSSRVAAARRATSAPAPSPVVSQECVEGYLFVPAPLRLLILRRPPARGGIWVPVSGKVEAADSGFEAALRRELREETGFSAFRRVLDLDWAVVFPGPQGGTWRLHAFGAQLERPLDPALSPEHDAFAWLPANDARGRLHYPDNRAAVDRLRETLGAVDEVD